MTEPSHFVSWLLTPQAPPITGGAVAVTPVNQGLTYLGQGITTPFARDANNDLGNARDLANVRSAVEQVLGTRAQSPKGHGELRWRTEFGSTLHLLRHRNQTATFRQFIAHYVRDALAQWEPRVRVVAVSVTSSALQPNIAVVQVVFQVLTGNTTDNRVAIPDQVVEVALAA